jgi:hypothetical protein
VGLDPERKLMPIEQEIVPPLPGDLDIARGQTEPNALFCVIRFVDGEMNPPDSIIVPKMMVRVSLIDPKSEGLSR